MIYSDTGIGMTHQELVDCLGTIAQSGTAKFLKALKVTIQPDFYASTEVFFFYVYLVKFLVFYCFAG